MADRVNRERIARHLQAISLIAQNGEDVTRVSLDTTMANFTVYTTCRLDDLLAIRRFCDQIETELTKGTDHAVTNATT